MGINSIEQVHFKFSEYLKQDKPRLHILNIGDFTGELLLDVI